MKWSVRSLLNPVITRVLLFGTNPIDLEYVLRKVEETPIMNGKALAKVWTNEWSKKADRFIELAKQAEEKKMPQSMYQYNMLAAQCYYACYMINSEDIDMKRDVYKKLVDTYQMAVKSRENKVELLKIPVDHGKDMYTYLHWPKEKKKSCPCVILFSGLGSCKEELEMLVRPFVDRGIAVLACDMPGAGESLFESKLKCISSLVETSFGSIVKALTNKEGINEQRLATCGLCMGGGYAYRMAAKYSNVVCCASLFPLFFKYLSDSVIPRWMKEGKWALFQNGDSNGKAESSFCEEMAVMSAEPIQCDYLLVHSVYDNWMKLEEINAIYERSLGYKEQILIEEEPVYASKEAVMHAMPVGEQMHWIKHVVADWVCERFNAACMGEGKNEEE